MSSNADWVLQTSTKDDLTLEGSPEQIQKALIAMYKRDYTDEWKQFVQGISVRHSRLSGGYCRHGSTGRCAAITGRYADQGRFQPDCLG
jgi:hypothetical protein